ncbi:MAG TPA: FdtA/QdtA family cupin domain-containing protein [Luteibaculaceae bacterium]|nr:FdtA/QdtA family cupin domain-containing protein [Luteibaculaceae bacterium]
MGPRIISFNSVGSSDIGFISVAQENIEVPFEIKRVYWTYYTPQSVVRGGHANIGKELVLVAVAGTINVSVEDIYGNKTDFLLDTPSVGLYIPKLCWHTMKYSHNAVQMVMASNNYSPEDYIRDYRVFQSLHAK